VRQTSWIHPQEPDVSQTTLKLSETSVLHLQKVGNQKRF
jgi:hypothetical protein